MNIGSILNQVLGASQQISNKHQQGGLDLPGGININNDMLKGLGGGAAAAGLLSMLMGGKGGLGINSKTAKLGSMAAIGALAYKAYQSWQANNSAGQSNLQHFQPSHERNAQQAENDSQLIVKAMIAAANADGRIDPSERQAILTEIGQESLEVQRWIEIQLDNPPTPQSLAREIGNDKALAAEVYLASRIISGELDRKEIVYLHELSAALNLEEELVEQLEVQAGF